jgi:hypothetical protein
VRLACLRWRRVNEGSVVLSDESRMMCYEKLLLTFSDIIIIA